jgi:hypothetical protein
VGTAWSLGCLANLARWPHLFAAQDDRSGVAVGAKNAHFCFSMTLSGRNATIFCKQLSGLLERYRFIGGIWVRVTLVLRGYVALLSPTQTITQVISTAMCGAFSWNTFIAREPFARRGPDCVLQSSPYVVDYARRWFYAVS